MAQSSSPQDDVAQQVREALVGEEGARPWLTATAVRSAALKAVRGTRRVGRGAGNIAREAVEGTVQAVGEIGGEAGVFVRDAVVGVVQGTGQVVRVTAPTVREVVVGAVRGSGKARADLGEASRGAVEGAIVGAASVGVDTTQAAAAAVEGAVEAVVEAGGDLREAAHDVVGGVLTSVAAAGGDVADATRDAAYTLIAQAAEVEPGVAEVAAVAERAVDSALQGIPEAGAEAQEIVAAAASGAVEAAYNVSRSHGESVRQSVLRRVLEPGFAVAPGLERQLAEFAERLSTELPKGRAAWRGASLARAVRLLLNSGGIDLAGSLAYFMIMSLLPMVALAIMAVALFGDPEDISDRLTSVLSYYFPSSQSLLLEAVENLLQGSLAIGLVAVVGLVLGANGLFLAMHRALNRVFGSETRRAVQLTLTQVTLTTVVVLVFLLSVGLTASLQLGVRFGEGIGQSFGVLSSALLLTLGIISAALPALFTMVAFAVVYQRMPTVHVEWRDATFGAMAAIVLFEVAKHAFFWFTGLTSQRNAVYGPLASSAILLAWAYVAGMIFLYGAALARAAGELRPAQRPPDPH